jgi:hypothetical protein
MSGINFCKTAKAYETVIKDISWNTLFELAIKSP